VIDLPPPSYEQTIEAIVQCDIPRGNIRVAYSDFLQSDEITVSDLGPVDETKLRCLKTAVHPFYILTLDDMTQRSAFYEFSEREDRPKQKSDATDWLRSQGLFDSLPSFILGQSAAEFAIAAETACGLEPGSALMAFDKSWITVRPEALPIETFEKSARKLECLTNMIAASDAYENGIRFGFIANGAYDEEQK
jgi:hypothetical protein